MQEPLFPNKALSRKILIRLLSFPLFVLVPLTVVIMGLWDYLVMGKYMGFGIGRFVYNLTLVKSIPFLSIKMTTLLTILITDILSFIFYIWHINPILHYLKTGEHPEKAEKKIFTGFNLFFWPGYISLAYLYGTFFAGELVDLGDEKMLYLVVGQLFSALIWAIFVISAMLFTRFTCAPIMQMIGSTRTTYKEALFIDKVLPFLPLFFFLSGIMIFYYRSIKFLFYYGQMPQAPPISEQFIYIALILGVFLFMILGLNHLVRLLESQERGPIQGELIKLSQGRADLTQRLLIPARNGRGVFVSDFNHFLDKFLRQTLRLKHSVSGIGTGVSQLKLNFNRISQSAESQKKEIGPVSESVNQISQGMVNLIGGVKDKYDYIADNLRHIDEIAAGIEEIITFFQGIKKQSFKSLATANIVMKQIKESMDQSSQMTESMALISAKIQEAGQEAEHIDEILILIQDISEQTNILSINAAIEAAHAGDDGKGFAIVANEVRTLATESSKAVEHISKKLLDIQVLIRNSVEMTLEAEKITKENNTLVSESYELINTMIEQFNKTGRITENTAAIIAQQGDITRSFHKQVRSMLIFFENLRSTMINQESSFKDLSNTLEALTESFDAVSTYNEMVQLSIESVVQTGGKLSGLVNVFRTE